MNYAQLNKFDTANGPGCRVSLFVSGCRIECPHCFNRALWNFDYGSEFTEEVKQQMFEYLGHPYIDGISILGGEPFADEHWMEVFNLIVEIRQKYPNKTILCYSGYTMEQIRKDGKGAILDAIDILIDGPYIHEQRNPDLIYRGSNNQRIIRMKEVK